MVKQITCYEDAKGVIHKSPFDAHRADLAIWLARSEDVSDTSAKKLADRIAGSREELDELIGMLTACRDTQPERPTAVAPAGYEG